MTAAKKLSLISVDDYLDGELDSPIKHEYVGGVVYAMAGAKNVHNLIASNVLGVLHGRLRGKRCWPYNSYTKIRMRLNSRTIFYYPDVSVICRPNPPDDSFQDDPAVIVEILSRKTRRIDSGEKKDAYLTIPSLGVYLMVEQSSPVVVAFRRGEHGFTDEVYAGLDSVIPLPELETELPLAEIYEGASLSPESADDDER